MTYEPLKKLEEARSVREIYDAEKADTRDFIRSLLCR